MSDPMSNYRVVPYQRERLPELEALWREYLDDQAAVDNRHKYFRWLAERNPFLGGDSPYYLLLDGDRVIGMHGHMPLQLSVNGQAQRVYLAHDDLLAAECRGKGLGKVMLDGVAALNDSFAGALWHNAPNRKLYAKCGWTDCSKLVSQRWTMDPRRNVEARLGRNPLAHTVSFVVRQMRAARNALSQRGRSRAYEVTETDRFDDRFDDLFERSTKTLPIVVARTADYLNWKFVDKPDNRYLRFAATDSTGALRAYVVVSDGDQSVESSGKILDFLVDPGHPEALDVAIRAALDSLQARGVLAVDCVGSPLAMSCLGRFGFRQRPSETGFMFTHWESSFDADFVTDINNWYITASDADGDAWRSS